MKYDLVSLGEILIDFTPAGLSEAGKKLYEENPGGAPANCAGALAKLGGKSAFLGMTGLDSFGDDAKQALDEIGVDTSGMKTTSKQHTTLAFVNLDPNGERHFSFCRNPGADTQLSENDLDLDKITNTKIFHVGSLSLTDEPSKSATYKAVELAKKSGAVISYDPNYREKLWNGKKDAVSLMKSIIPLADIVKVSEEELYILYGKCSRKEGVLKILKENVHLVLITLGAEGVYYAGKDSSGDFIDGIIGVPEVNVVDTTCAGDSFTGGLLYCLTRKESPLDFTKTQLEEYLEFANSVASICVTRRGAIPALPSLPEVTAFIKQWKEKQ